MKSIFSLTALSLAGVAILMTSSPAHAQDRGARFTFSPNKFALEQPNTPAWHPPVDHHKVSHGVARGSFLSGVDPNFLKPIAKPQTQIAVIPQMMPQQNLTGQFHHSFGKPEAHEQSAPVVAHNAPIAATPKAISLPPVVEEKAVAAKRLPSRSNNANLSGKLIRKKAPAAQMAKANSMQVASYQNSKYYSPGAYVPSNGGGASEAKVYGHVIPRK